MSCSTSSSPPDLAVYVISSRLYSSPESFPVPKGTNFAPNRWLFS